MRMPGWHVDGSCPGEKKRLEWNYFMKKISMVSTRLSLKYSASPQIGSQLNKKKKKKNHLRNTTSYGKNNIFSIPIHVL